jgi:hypothetical protein
MKPYDQPPPARTRDELRAARKARKDEAKRRRAAKRTWAR